MRCRDAWRLNNVELRCVYDVMVRETVRICCYIVGLGRRTPFSLLCYEEGWGSSRLSSCVGVGSHSRSPTQADFSKRKRHAAWSRKMRRRGNTPRQRRRQVDSPGAPPGAPPLSLSSSSCKLSLCHTSELQSTGKIRSKEPPGAMRSMQAAAPVEGAGRAPPRREHRRRREVSPSEDPGVLLVGLDVPVHGVLVARSPTLGHAALGDGLHPRRLGDPVGWGRRGKG